MCVAAHDPAGTPHAYVGWLHPPCWEELKQVGSALRRLKRDLLGQPSYTCPLCHRTTYLEGDIEHEYCPCCGSDLLPKTCEHRS
jgi:hypothetical protein